MSGSAPQRERLLGSTRRAARDDVEDAVVAPRRVAPGKLTAADATPADRERPIAPGKVSRIADDDTAISPAEALRLASSLWIDRRAEAADVDDGSLATAFTFLDDARGGQPLPPALLARFTAELGVDLSHVRVHIDDRAARAADVLKARAFTIGSDIFFAAGAYDPTSGDGLELIAHELVHVVDNQRGVGGRRRVSRPDDPHEQRADEIARRLRGRVELGARRDPATLVNDVRERGQRVELPFLRDLEQHFGMPLDFVETYTGEAARLACELMTAGAFAVRNIVALADPSPQRETLLHELAHVIQTGGRAARAPTMFAPGSLSVSDPASEAEHDARAVAGGARVGATASPDVVHRETTPPEGKKPAPEWKESEAEERWLDFVTNPKHQTIKLSESEAAAAAVFVSEDGKTRYLNTSKEPFLRSHYQQVIGLFTEEGKAKSDPDLDRLHGKKGPQIGLVQVTAMKWAWIDKTESPPAKVKLVHEKAREKPDPNKSYQSYCTAVSRLKEYLKDFTHVEIDNGKGGKKYKLSMVPGVDEVTDDDDPTGMTAEGQADKVRAELIKRICAVQDFHIKDGQWETFFTKVIKPVPTILPSRIQGDAFAAIVKDDLGKAAVPLPISKDEVFFYNAAFQTQKKQRNGDGFVTDGRKIMVECKSGPWLIPDPSTDVGAADETIKQAQDYARIIKPDGGADGKRIKATREDPPAQLEFDQVLYVFPTKDMAKKWAPNLKKAFETQGVKVDDKSKLLIFPDPEQEGIGTVKVTANPTFDFELRDKKTTTHQFTNPPIVHSGMTVKKATIKTKAPGTADVASGSEMVVDFGLGAGKAVEGKSIKKPIKAENGPMARIDNKFDGLKTSLDKILKRVDVDARLIDNGVEATIKVKPGASGIPKIDLKEAAIKATYVSGKLAVDGEIGVAHQNGKISGSVKVAWNGASWSFTGSATVGAGMVDGLSEFTATVAYEDGKWRFGVDRVSYEKKLKAVTLTGTAFGVEYDVDKGNFSGEVQLDADLGMFGKASASAKIEHNKLKKAKLDYDSPTLKYPKDKDPPAFSGTVGGTVTYEDGKLHGSIRGSANINVPGLSKFTNGEGLGLAVDADVHADGSYEGSIRTTKPIKLGDHFEIPKIACTIKKDGSIEGDFSIKVVKFKYLDHAEVECSVTKDGITVKKVDVEFKIGSEKDKLWGTARLGYEEKKGLTITGDVHAKLKEDMVANGKLTYSTETNVVDITLGIDEIKLFEFKETKSLFKAKKQIPLVSFYQILGIYLDLGFELSFEFDFNLAVKPTLKLEGMSLDTFEYKKISAEMELLGGLAARLIGTPNLGLGIFALSPSVLRGGGGLKLPITGEALISPKGKFNVGYSPDGGVDGDAQIGMMMTFGIKAALKPYAEAVLLDGVWKTEWTGDALAEFEILKPKELFNFTIDFGKETKKQDPKLPEENAAKDPTPPTAAKVLPETKGKDKDAAAAAPTVTTDPKESGDSGPFGMDALKPMLEGLPGYATIKKYMDKAAAAYKKISEFLGRIFNALKNVFNSIIDKIEEILDGFANEGLGYIKKLVKMVLGDAVYEIVEPVVDAVASTAEKIVELFETDPPTSVTDFFPWCLKLMKKVWNIGFDGIRQLASALWTMLENLVAAAGKIANYMVQKGMIGVQRHCYYIWKPIGPNYYFLAASQYKIHILGFDDEHKEEGMLNNPKSAIGQILFEVLEALDVPPTYEGWEPDAKESYRDRWVGGGAGASLGQTVAQMMQQHQQKKREELPETPQRKGKPGSGVEPVMTRPPKE